MPHHLLHVSGHWPQGVGQEGGWRTPGGRPRLTLRREQGGLEHLQRLLFPFLSHSYARRVTTGKKARATIITASTHVSCYWVAKLCLTMTLCTAAHQASLSSTISFAKIHVLWVDDAIPPSHPLSLPSPPALNLSQHQGLFQWVGSSHQMAKVLELQPQSFQWIFRVDCL